MSLDSLTPAQVPPMRHPAACWRASLLPGLVSYTWRQASPGAPARRWHFLVLELGGILSPFAICPGLFSFGGSHLKGTRSATVCSLGTHNLGPPAVAQV